MKKQMDRSLETRLSRILCSTTALPLMRSQLTKVFASEAVNASRLLRTHLDLLKPDTSQRVRASQEQHRRTHSRPHDILSGTKVYVRNFGSGVPWIPGIIQDARGPVSFMVELDDGRIIRRYADRL